jgi:hypothetical protein
MRKQIRQGDILLIPIASFPTGLKNKDKTLAYGEVTGHSHRFDAPDDEVLVKVTQEGTQYIDVMKPSILKHEEHGHIEVPEGKYILRRQREHDATESVGQQVRRVSD